MVFLGGPAGAGSRPIRQRNVQGLVPSLISLFFGAVGETAAIIGELCAGHALWAALSGLQISSSNKDGVVEKAVGLILIAVTYNNRLQASGRTEVGRYDR